MMRLDGTRRSLRSMGLPTRSTTRGQSRGTGASHRPGPALRAGELLLAVAFDPLRPSTPASAAVTRVALELARERMRRHEALRQAARRRRIRRSIMMGSLVLAAAAAGTGRARGSVRG